MNLEFASISIAGAGGKNEDSVLATQLDSSTLLLAVADGVGGHSAGEVASSTAITVVHRLLQLDRGIEVAEFFESINREITIAATANPLFGDMATTLTACVVTRNLVRVLHVGDCRVFQLRGNGLTTHTQDQTEVQRLLDDGILTREKARRYRRRNVLLSALSREGKFTPTESSFEVTAGDRILVVSDGFYKEIGKAKLRDLSKESQTLEKLANRLREYFGNKPLNDDCSVAICEI